MALAMCSVVVVEALALLLVDLAGDLVVLGKGKKAITNNKHKATKLKKT
jgi:hypothetical protein